MALFVLSLCPFDISVGVGAFVIGLSQISSFFFEHLLSQIHGPVMMVGDFNSHNPLWGSDYITPKGRVVENFISQNDLCLFNDSSYTFLHSGNGSYSAIDLSFASPTLFDRFSWEVHDDCCGSDHFPLYLTSS